MENADALGKVIRILEMVTSDNSETEDAQWMVDFKTSITSIETSQMNEILANMDPKKKQLIHLWMTKEIMKMHNKNEHYAVRRQATNLGEDINYLTFGLVDGKFSSHFDKLIKRSRVSLDDIYCILNRIEQDNEEKEARIINLENEIIELKKIIKESEVVELTDEEDDDEREQKEVLSYSEERSQARLQTMLLITKKCQRI